MDRGNDINDPESAAAFFRKLFERHITAPDTSRDLTEVFSGDITRRRFNKALMFSLLQLMYGGSIPSFILNRLNQELEETEHPDDEHNGGLEAENEPHHHETPFTDFFSVTGTTALIVGLTNSLRDGHFHGDDWSAILTNLTAFLGSLTLEEGIEKTGEEVFAIVRDMIILSAIITGGAFGDKLLESKKELGLPSTIEIPDGYDVTLEVMREILSRMSGLIIENAPVNIVSTGAGAIVLNESLVAVADRLIVKHPLAWIEKVIADLETAIKNIDEDEFGSRRILVFQEVKEIVIEALQMLENLKEIQGKTARLSEFKEAAINVPELSQRIQNAINDVGLMARENGNLEQFTELKEQLQKLNEALETSIPAILDENKWNAMGDYIQAYRSVANLLGKFIGPIGDPPNAVLVIKMAFGELPLNLEQLIVMQTTGFAKIWQPLTQRLIQSEKRMMEAFGFSDYDPEATLNILEQVRTTAFDLIPQQARKAVDIAEAFINGDDEKTVEAALGEEVDEESKRLLRETLSEMKEGFKGLNRGLKRMNTNPSNEKYGDLDKIDTLNLFLKVTKYPNYMEGDNIDFEVAQNIAFEEFLNKRKEFKEHAHKHVEQASVYRLLHALRVSNQVDVEQVLTLVINGHLSYDVALVESLNKFIEDRELTTEEQESIPYDLQQIFGDLDAAYDLLVKLAVIKEAYNNPDNPDIHTIVKKFDYKCPPQVLIQEILHAVKHNFGPGTEEIAALVTLQFLSGPMVAHAFRVYIVQPVIDRQIKIHGKVIDIGEVIDSLLGISATSPESDNGLVVNVGSTILVNLLNEGLITIEQFIDGLYRLYNSAIEAGDLLRTGGPASAPFTDEAFNALIQGWQFTLSNFAANIPIAGESAIWDIPKNWAYYGFVQFLTDLQSRMPEFPEIIPEKVTSILSRIAGTGANFAIGTLDKLNPAIITDILTNQLRKSGDNSRNELVNGGVEMLTYAVGNIRSNGVTPVAEE